MSTRSFGTVGAAVGGAVGSAGGALGSFIGAAIGRQVGTSIGGKVNGRAGKASVGRHLANLAVQSSSYGEPIPIVYGSGRIAGNIIWALPIKEVVASQGDSSSGKGGGGQKAAKSNTDYSYYVTMAIAICEGKVDEMVRIWADAKIINQADYTIRFYNGTSTQTPDSLIEATQGIGKTPAYRGLAYVVVEDFPLGDFGNRIPNFTFEVTKNTGIATSGEEKVEEMVNSIVLIPGAGEFVYDDIVQSKIPGEFAGEKWAQRGNINRINQNNRSGKADILVALDQLKIICPNVEWVAPVVCWFGDGVDAGQCVIKPGVEYKEGATTGPDVWQVGGLGRATARQITLINGSPQYGGTPSDASLLRYLSELKSRGYNIMFNPMLFMDVEAKPWRGRISGTALEAEIFFTKTNGYNEFIIHYAKLVKGLVDAFVIGSELMGLTAIKDNANNFPAVDCLVNLAARVKAILGSGVKVTYAADWSEYHHSAGGWYNLDKLWASPDIDMVGIDAYFPLTDAQEPTSGFALQEIMAGWDAGEGYDFYYTDSGRTMKADLSAAYAWKNIGWWWNNYHVNPDGATSAWVPTSKKIWFTEYGFPSVDGCSNQPNVFYDPDSSESNFPYLSRGRVDFRAQRNAIKATEKKWQGSNMVERKFLWTWDARPFPFWPDLNAVWADGKLWKYGHWVQGKFGALGLAAIVADLSKRAGLNESQFDISRLGDIVDGYIIKGQTSIHDAIDDLRSAYFFDAVESAGQVKYIKRGGGQKLLLNQGDLVENGGQLIHIGRAQELELPQKIDVVYLNKEADYQVGNQHSQRLAVSSLGAQTVDLMVVMNGQLAKNIADVTLYNNWQERTNYEFSLPLKYAYLEPTDMVELSVNGVLHNLRVVATRLDSPGVLKVSAVAQDLSAYDFYNEPGIIAPQISVVGEPGDTILLLLDLPPLPLDAENSGYIRYAACGLEHNWHGAAVFGSEDNGANYSQLQVLNDAAVIGVATTSLGEGVVDIFDYENTVIVSLYGFGQLESVPKLAVLNGANIAKIGDEIIQFEKAILLAENKYMLSGLLRGRLGTEASVSGHVAGELFVLIDNRLGKQLQANAAISIEKLYKGVSFGQSLEDVAAQKFIYNANALRPFSPVHIKGARDANANLIISWIRRTRNDGQWRDYVDAPLGEAHEQYEVEIMDGGRVARTINGLTSPLVIYSADSQLADFGSVPASVSVRVCQISQAVGRGEMGVVVV